MIRHHNTDRTIALWSGWSDDKLSGCCCDYLASAQAERMLDSDWALAFALSSQRINRVELMKSHLMDRQWALLIQILGARLIGVLFGQRRRCWLGIVNQVTCRINFRCQKSVLGWNLSLSWNSINSVWDKTTGRLLNVVFNLPRCINEPATSTGMYDLSHPGNWNIV